MWYDFETWCRLSDKAYNEFWPNVTWARWRQIWPIPANYVSRFLRCEVCAKPREQATHFQRLPYKVLFCERHAKAQKNKYYREALPKLKEKQEEQERLAREYHEAWKDFDKIP